MRQTKRVVRSHEHENGVRPCEWSARRLVLSLAMMDGGDRDQVYVFVVVGTMDLIISKRFAARMVVVLLERIKKMCRVCRARGGRPA